MKFLGLGIPELLIMLGVLLAIALPILIVLLIIKIVFNHKDSGQNPRQ